MVSKILAIAVEGNEDLRDRTLLLQSLPSRNEPKAIVVIQTIRSLRVPRPSHNSFVCKDSIETHSNDHLSAPVFSIVSRYHKEPSKFHVLSFLVPPSLLFRDL
jgi:hypothetical protein